MPKIKQRWEQFRPDPCEQTLTFKQSIEKFAPLTISASGAAQFSLQDLYYALSAVQAGMQKAMTIARYTRRRSA